ncbi:ATP-dependent DNA helicase RecG [Candidatus Venteria ishoeyi]|uniref:ATP-dependent DNA helicase RecG n=1 Tax=Candidatus Venteria ishoeyi TaxID=1899563 RepID=A0A1H6F9U8_9GAMM|nr:ATP-dependent DNA helicase RecG [Candidatus Venteria ishoeyi]SEH06151.1 ATP-dependent DNA helicase RecG [Candidatus Venteria ishoeyi]
MDKEQALTHLTGIGPRIAQKLEKLGIVQIQDLLFHLPLRYQDRTKIKPIGQLQEGEDAVIEAEIEATEIKNGRRRSLVSMLNDGTGSLMLRLFHFSSAQQQQLAPGERIRCFGEVRQGFNCLELIHPEYQHVHRHDSPPLAENLTPIYPATEGLHQNLLRKLIKQALEYPVDDLLPAALLHNADYPKLEVALQLLHTPPANSDIEQLFNPNHPARQRLAFEELLAQHLSLRLLRGHTVQRRAPTFNNAGLMCQKLLNQLPFRLTQAQRRVNEEIQRDLVQVRPMQRLVQGDVGSGKTVIAALAALQALESGYQVAVMAPTELLAEQHLRTFQQWLEPLQIEPAWLAGSLTKKQREAALADIASGETALTIGTHALFQDSVEFSKLGLMIIDEQHRFGVHQRLALRDKGSVGNLHPHQLIMTATPIPRTLAMTAYADLDTSIIDELPPGRSPITTVAMPETRREAVIERVAQACEQGRQAYWVCTLVEESETLDSQAAEATAEQLRMLLPQLRIGLAHGRMKAKDKETVMQAFKAGELDLLVATTVIEVGVDVQNASLMIIENAERLGLAQLHQLRGRVGRGSVESYCLLLYHPPLSRTGQSRLGTLRETQDGFVIAQRDLELRGPGEVLGTRQTGLVALKIADLQRDQHLLEKIQDSADLLLQQHPQRAQALVQRWVNQGMTYGEVY